MDIIDAVSWMLDADDATIVASKRWTTDATNESIETYARARAEVEKIIDEARRREELRNRVLYIPTTFG